MSPKRTTETVPRLPTPTGAWDSVVRRLLQIVQAMVVESTPTMGTIKTVGEGEIVVQIDDERGVRSIGFARQQGVQYAQNQRVLIVPIRGGEFIVCGIMGSGATDHTVNRPQLAFNAVGASELAGGVVGFGHLDQPMFNAINTSAPYSYVNKADNDIYEWVNKFFAFKNHSH